MDQHALWAAQLVITQAIIFVNYVLLTVSTAPLQYSVLLARLLTHYMVDIVLKHAQIKRSQYLMDLSLHAKFVQITVSLAQVQ
jgi:hypothetical protein